jgi:hypothetical protein
VTLCVFLGPTLGLEEARKRLPEAVYLPPVRAGDVLRAVRDGFMSIGIIDGLFEQVPSVWHKEILFALSGGARVYGAASMGALRAAELHTFGMTGLGAIFEAYRSGELEDDDEVAVSHGDRDVDFRPLSDAMASIRFGLRRAQDEGVIREPLASALIRIAKATFYPERSWRALLAAARTADVDREELARLESWVMRDPPNQKREDALVLLERMASDLADGQPPSLSRAPVFEPTIFWDLLRTASEAKTSAHPPKRVPGK